MRRAFHDRFHRDIGVSRELVVRQEMKDTSNKTREVKEGLEELLDAESDYSLWKKRDDMWMRRK